MNNESDASFFSASSDNTNLNSAIEEIGARLLATNLLLEAMLKIYGKNDEIYRQFCLLMENQQKLIDETALTDSFRQSLLRQMNELRGIWKRPDA